MRIKQRIVKFSKRIARNLKCLDGSFAKPFRVNLEWWKQRENIGDGISPIICEYMLSKKGLSLNSISKKIYHLTAVGSICGAGRMDLTVWGSGIHHQVLMDNIVRFKKYRKLDVRAVRGPETEKFLNDNGIKCPKVYGDPAIIMPLIYEPVRRVEEYDVSLVIHISQKNSSKIPENVHLIDIESNDYKRFIDELAASKKIISSSLHGIILAESYGVPAVFLCEGMEDQMMKYKDWYYSTGRFDFRTAHTIEEAMNMEPILIPDLSVMRNKLMEVFPYDLWL